MIIPERVVEFLQGPSFIQIGTRDRELRPLHAFAVGAFVHDDRETVTVFVPTARAAPILANLADNGRIAVGAARASHEAYQLKGTSIASRPTDAADLARQDAYRAALLADVLAAGYPAEIARPFTLGFAWAPGTAITFRVEQIFQQTPGPDAGKPLS